MKKSLKTLLSALLATTMIFGIGCGDGSGGGQTGDTGDKKKLPTSEYEDGDTQQDEYVDNTPEDPGTPADHIFEAESATFIGTSTSLNKACIAASYFFDLSFGDSTIIRMITNTANKYVFQFNSDKAYKVKMEVAVASAYSGSKWEERNLSAMYDIMVNERQVQGDVVVPAGTADQMKGGNAYTCIQHVEIPISLVEGNNLIVFNVLAGVCNLDYINIKTSANISGYTENYWDDGDTEISIPRLPTTEEAGSIKLTCAAHNKNSSFALPALKEENGYTVAENGAVKAYSFKFNGQMYTFSDDGAYDLPEGVIVTEPEFELEPEAEEVQDPNIPAPEAVTFTNDKSQSYNFFDSAKWTAFGKGDDKGGSPTIINGAAKFARPSRFDFFYVKGKNGNYIHLGEMASKYAGYDIYGKDYSWTLTMSARYNFDMLLFGTANAPSEYGQNSAAGVYLTFESGKILVKNAWYNTESTEAVAEGSIPTALTFDGKTEFTVKINVKRVDGDNLQFSLEINGAKIDLTATGKGKQATVADGVVNLKFTSAGSYGQRLCIMPHYKNNVVRVYGVTKSESVDTYPTTPVDPTPDPDTPPVTGNVPEVTVNGKNFFDPAKWTTFTSGTAGAIPVVDGDALKFENPSRFEFFYVKDAEGKQNHIGDHSNNIKANIYGTEYSWTLQASASGSFNMILFGGGTAPADFSGSGAGVYLTFANDKISVRNAYTNEVKDVIAEGAIPNGLTLDGTTKFTVTVKATRIDKTNLKFAILVNGEEVVFTAVEGVTPTCTNVENGTVKLTFTGNSYGQRLCVVPGESTVKIYNLTLPE